MNYIYLDNNSTTVIDPNVFDAMQPYLTDLYGNPSAKHTIGESTHEGLTQASDQIYFSLNINPKDTLIMTSCATESINSVHHSILLEFLKNPKSKKNKIISSSLEHYAVVKSLEHLTQFGIEIINLPIIDQSFTVEDFLKVYSPEEILLVSLGLVNSETGIVHPIKQIAEICQKDKVLIHTDATQAIGKIPVDFSELNVDYLSLSGHKFHAPKGVGALIIRDDAPFSPLFYGGSQMGGFRAGTLNVAGIVGLGEACYSTVKNIDKYSQQVSSHRQHLETFLQTINNCTIYGINQQRIPNTTYFNIEGVDLEHFAWFLKQNIAISTGSACSSVVPNSNTSQQKARGIRVSLSKYNTKEDIDTLITQIQAFLTKYRS